MFLKKGEIQMARSGYTNCGWIVPRQAIEVAKEMGFNIVKVTLLTWCKKYKFAKKVVGRWYIHKEKFLAFMEEGKKYMEEDKKNVETQNS